MNPLRVARLRSAATVLLALGWIGTAGALHVSGEGLPGAGEMQVPVHGEPLELAPGTPVPTLTLEVLADPVSGWNVYVEVTDFAFSPRRAGLAHVPGEGHAHLYANGEKIARLYGSWFHLDGLPAGTFELVVTLNSNDHRTLAVAGRLLYASVLVEVSAEQAAGAGGHHDH